MEILITPVVVIYTAQILLVALTGAFLWHRSHQPAGNVALLRYSAATFLVLALTLGALLGDEALTSPWDTYTRFWIMSLIAALGFPLFALLYHLPVWIPQQRREFQIVMLLLVPRLAYEVYLGATRTLALLNDGVLIDRRPWIADLIALAFVLWLLGLIVRRMRFLKHRSGQFISEAILLGLLVMPATLSITAYSLGWISQELNDLVRNLMLVFITPLMVLVFLDLLPESISMLVRLVGLSLVIVITLMSATALWLGTLFSDALLHTVMLRLTGLTAIAFVLVLLGVPLLLRRSVLRPLRAVLSGVRQADAGDLTVQVPVTFDDEIGTLTKAFNRMVGEIRTTVGELEDRVAARTAELSRSEARYRELVEQIDEALFRVNLEEPRIEFLSPSIERMLGYPVSALLADPLLLGEHLAPNEIAAAHERQAALLRGDVVPQYVYRVIDAFGRERWIEQSNTAVYRGERVIALEGVLRDVTIQQEAEHRLREQQRELAALQERERISRDLHDGLGQVMGYVNLQAQTAGALAATGQTAAAQAILTQLVQVAQSSHTDIRRYILDLRAPDAPNAAEPWLTQLRRQIAQFEQLYGLRVQLSGTPILEDAPFGAPIGHEVVQIVLEALNNVKKHAGVNAAHVTVQQTADQLTLIVADQGAGFAPEAAAHDRTAGPSGLGMRMMTERAALIHADLQFESAPGRGTQVVLRVPLYAPVEPAAVQQAEPIDMSRLRILLVDDHPLFRAGMRNLLALHGIQVIGEAEDGRQAQELAHALRPDMILMDMHMPHCSGVAATAAIKAQLPDTRIIMLTVAAEEENLFQALQAGASGYLLKNLDSSAFFQLLAEAMRGEVVLSQGLATQTLTALTQAPPPASAAAAARLAFLTARQREILELAAQGRTYKQIAADLFISEATVKYHMGQAIALLQVANRREALALLRQS